ncbi:VOC family protein [uncultured Draconibacterium sp.]|uniref:SMU1112c/YaeR family gloxylase I-like metalloprotein n=1 Tax=uncultured Draconibacterium sp. TaxID=1573823 RepID=UPI0025F082DF|nr:VOC family protein [uncultured Draconibacterium sp.]
MLNKIHHIAIICSDYQQSKHFYTKILELQTLQETYRKERDSWKLDLALGGDYVIELFSFPNPPQRVNQPEARGLRHLAFEVDCIEETVFKLNKNGVETEAVRTDALSGKKFTFFFDPDGLPLEIYEK